MVGTDRDTWEVRFSKKAEKDLARLRLAGRADLYEGVWAGLDALEVDPVTHRSGADIRGLSDHHPRLWRMRVADRRILYEVQHSQRVVQVTRIVKRSRAHG